MALIGYTQISTDGAAFVAAHTVVTDPSASPGPVVNGIFPNISADSVNASAGHNIQNATVSKSAAGFSLLPGVASMYNLGGGDTEYQPSAPASGVPSFAFAANAVLYNYCYPGTSCAFPAAYSMYLAQTLNPNGNGTNGQFTEWGCHDGYFDSLLKAFPSSRPSGGIKAGSALDMTSSGTVENDIYSWDGGTHTCS